MKQGFIRIINSRIKLSAIKKYDPITSNTEKFGIKIFYSLSSKRDHDTFYFAGEAERNVIIQRIDDALEVA